MRDDDLDREIDTHLELMARENQDRGMSADAARRTARTRLGSRANIREDVRSISRFAAWSDAVQDLRYGLRLLAKRPGFAVAAALTLALGVGAVSTIFSVVEAVLLRPLPYSEADRLAMVWEDVKMATYVNPQNSPAPGNFTDWRARNSTFVDLAAIRSTEWTLTGAGDPIRISGAAASTSMFQLLNVYPVLGRVFTPEEGRAFPPRVVLLGHGLWVDRFAANPAIVGRTIQLNDASFLVAGVMPSGFHFPDADVQVWTPLGLPAQQLTNHDGHILRVLGRLKPGVTFAQAQADLDRIAAALATEYPRSNSGMGVSVVPLSEQIVGDVRRPLQVISAVVGFLLLMVCTNIGNLLLVRASARQQEFAVRSTLGASRTRLLRQLLAEGIVLAAIGGAAGLIVASSGVQALRTLAPANLPRVDEISLDRTVVLFNAGIALLAGLGCSVFPALRSSTCLGDALRAEGRSSVTAAPIRLRNLLVIVQVASSVVVLVAAGLLLQSLVRLVRIPVGFRSEGVLTFRVALPPARYRSVAQRTAFYQQMSERLNALPGASSAAAVSFLPLTMSGRMTGISIDKDVDGAQVRMVDFRSTLPGYFHAMSIPLLAGRDAAWSDGPTNIGTVVISETAARTFWPGEAAVGKRLKLGRPGDERPWLTVVGVVGDVRQLDLVRAPRPALYFPATQDPGPGDMLRDWVVRTSGDPIWLASAIRQTVWSVDSSLAVTHLRTMTEWKSAATASQQFTLLLVGLFAVLALALAAVGVYGVTSYSVTQRTREIGIRIALGARRSSLVGTVLTQGAQMTGLGVLAGLTLAFALTRLITTLLFEVSPRDPMTFAGITALLLVVSFVASLIPAYRATRVDPITALRI